MESALDGKNIVLGVTGSIACYKALDLASKLVQAGATRRNHPELRRHAVRVAAGVSQPDASQCGYGYV